MAVGGADEADDLIAAADHVTAVDLAAATGRLLLGVRESGATGKELKDLGDRLAHEFLLAELTRRQPQDGVLSEEGVDGERRLSRARVWIVDPVDGTREFSEPPRVDWAVHVALAVQGEAMVGAVALPARGITLGTGDSFPAVRPLTHRPRMFVSRTRPGAHFLAMAEDLGAELVPMGSAGAKAMAVVLGEAEVYAHSGGMYEWDSAAPAAVARAAGMHVSRLDGSPLRYNRPDPWLPDLLICHPDLAPRVLELVRAHGWGT